MLMMPHDVRWGLVTLDAAWWHLMMKILDETWQSLMMLDNTLSCFMMPDMHDDDWLHLSKLYNSWQYFITLYAWYLLITLDDLSFEIYLVCVPVDTPADNTEGPLPNDLVHLVDVIKQYLLLVRHILRWLKPGRQLGCCSLGGLTLEIGLIFLVIIFKILFGKCWLGQITAWHK